MTKGRIMAQDRIQYKTSWCRLAKEIVEQSTTTKKCYHAEAKRIGHPKALVCPAPPPARLLLPHARDNMLGQGARPRVQVLEIRLQVLPVLFLGDPIDPNRCVCPLTVIGTCEGRTLIRCASAWNHPAGSRCARSTTFKSPGDMSSNACASGLVPSESSHQHGPPVLGRVQHAKPFPDVSPLVCRPPTPCPRRPRLRFPRIGSLNVCLPRVQLTLSPRTTALSAR